MEFAKQRQLCVNWVTAHDKPLHQDDQALTEEVLNKKRERWLSYHDQQTAGIMGLLPLVRGLPMRLTDSVNRGLGLYKTGLHKTQTGPPSLARACLACNVCEI